MKSTILFPKKVEVKQKTSLKKFKLVSNYNPEKALFGLRTKQSIAATMNSNAGMKLISAVESNDTTPAAKNKYPAKTGFLFLNYVVNPKDTKCERN